MKLLARNRFRLGLGFGLACAATCMTPAAADPTTVPAATQPAGIDAVPEAGSGGDLTKLSLEDLMNVEVKSVSRPTQSMADTPAAITVIGQDDIRRSGMQSIPELLRMAPGLDVARFNANQWAIGSRGLNDIYSNKLLVMMDGRTIYNPSRSGVFWDSVDYIIPDLDRIEVIRGPGATLWGSNAVNGVISITTKSADQTQGLLTSDGYSSQGYNASLRYGGRIDDRTFYRVYAKGTDTQNFKQADGSDAHDGWDSWRSGFRIDRHSTDADTFTLQSDIYQEHFGERFDVPVPGPPYSINSQSTNQANGQYMLARWSHVTSAESDWSLQLYYDRTERDDQHVEYIQHTVDADFHERFALGRRQEIIWGVGARGLSDAFETHGDDEHVNPAHRQDYILSAFVQDDVTLHPDLLHVIVGSKFEQTSYTGFEYQPSAKLLFTPDKRHTMWASASRAVRLPSRFDQTATINVANFPTASGETAESRLVGNPNIKSEELTALEIGTRFKPTDRLSVDVAGFANLYDKLRATPALTPFQEGTELVLPSMWDNTMSGETYGVETAATLNVSDKWRIVASHSFLVVTLHTHPYDPRSEHYFENSSPRNQFQLHSYYNVTKNIEFNAAAYYVEQLRDGTPSYVRLDAGITWRPKDRLELSVGVQNLLDNRHPEFGEANAATFHSEMPRTFYGQVTWQF